MATPNDVIQVVKLSRALSEEEQKELLELIPKMDEESLEKTQTLVLELGEAHLKKEEHQLEMLHFVEHQAQKMKTKVLKREEAVSQAQDESQAENLLSDL